MAKTHYIGKAGQLAVMSELALRGYNISIPEVDVGDDVFVLNEHNGKLSRVQVKTATGKKLIRTPGAYRCQFNVSAKHVSTTGAGTHYILAARCGASWRYLIFKRYILARLLHSGVGNFAGPNYILTVIFFKRREARTSTLRDASDLSLHAGRWELWEKLPDAVSSK